MATNSNLYRHADKALKKLFRLLESRLQRMATSLTKWDEVNVISAVNEVYSEVEQEAEARYLDIAQRAYKDASRQIIAIMPERKNRFTLPTALFIAGLLTSYDTKTEYVYSHEADRKRSRLSEALIAINSGQDVFNSNATREALRRAIVLMEGQLRNMADTVTDEARRQAFADAGVDEVIWVTQHDEKVCKVCRPRDGVKYKLFNVPAKHRNCRCYLVAATEDING